MELQDETIGRKLYAAFAIVMVTLLVITACTFFVIGKLEEFRRDVKHIMATQDKVAVTRDLQLQVALLWQSVTDASLTKNSALITEKAKPAFDRAHSDIEKLMELNKNRKEQVVKLEGLNNDLSGMWDTGNRVFTEYAQGRGNGKAVKQEYDLLSAKAINDAAALSDELGGIAKEDANTLSKKVGRVLHLITLMIIAAGVLGSLFAVFIIMIRKSVIKTLTRP